MGPDSYPQCFLLSKDREPAKQCVFQTVHTSMPKAISSGRRSEFIFLHDAPVSSQVHGCGERYRSMLNLLLNNVIFNEIKKKQIIDNSA